MWEYNHSNELYHHGIKGMKWGRRRFQNSDGSLTSAGKSRYGTVADVIKKHDSGKESKIDNHTPEAQQAAAEKRKKAIKVGAAVAATALAAYGGYKASQYIRSENGRIHRERGEKEANKVFNKYMNLYQRDMKSYMEAKTVAYDYKHGTRGVKDAEMHRIWSEHAKKAKNNADISSKMMFESSNRVRRQYEEKAKNENLLKATKNVAKYKINEKKKDLQYTRSVLKRKK